MMPLPYNELKATQAAALFIKLEGGRLPYLKLIKLLYLADRKSLLEYHEPITGDRLVSMEHGPVVSRILNRIRGMNEYVAEENLWNDYITTDNYDVTVTQDPGDGELCDNDIEIISSLSEKFRHLDQFQLRDWCHDNCREYVDPTKVNWGDQLPSGSLPIEPECILKVENRESEIPSFVEHIAAWNKMRAILHNPFARVELID